MKKTNPTITEPETVPKPKTSPPPQREDSPWILPDDIPFPKIKPKAICFLIL